MLALPAFLAVCAAPAQAGSVEAARNEISSALEEWTKIFNDRDPREVCGIFAFDLIANYQGQPERDYAAQCQLLLKSVNDPQRAYHYSLKINEILVSGDLAVVRLVWMLEIEREDGAPKQTIEEPGIDVFRRQADGSWKIARYLAYPASP
jgi:steroid delta-isomerase